MNTKLHTDANINKQINLPSMLDYEMSEDLKEKENRQIEYFRAVKEYYKNPSPITGVRALHAWEEYTDACKKHKKKFTER